MPSIQLKFKTDSEGFVSRECPSCKRIFKVQYGKGSDKPITHCPYCKHFAKESWYTKAQAKYIGDMAVQKGLGPELDKMFKGLKGMKVTSKRAPSPRAPTESNAAMPTQLFGCCGETIKHDNRATKLSCPICGTPAT